MHSIIKKYNDNNHTIYEILGLKFKKIDIKSALQSHNEVLPISIWETDGVSDALINYFEFVSRSSFAWRTYSPHFFLTYLSCLVEKKEYDKAEIIAKKFVQYNELNEIERYLPLCKFFKHLNYTNKRIDMGAYIYDYLEKSHQKEVFKNLLSNKTIAVVGNGPSEINTNNGNEIDSHDIVIRFNNYRTKGFEKDYGTKTNIWARGSGGDDVIDRKNPYDLITWEADYNHWHVAYNHLEIMYRQIESGQAIYNFDFKNHITLRKTSNIDFPTTGMVLIWEIYQKFGNFKNVDFYGFNFCQNKLDKYSTHYFNDRNKREAIARSSVHKLDAEGVFLQKLIGECK